MKRKSKKQGGNNKHHEKIAMQQEHMIDIALNGKTVHPSISDNAISLQEPRGARMFTPQMIAGLMQKKGTTNLR
jgi:hypothetical protein